MEKPSAKVEGFLVEKYHKLIKNPQPFADLVNSKLVDDYRKLGRFVGKEVLKDEVMSRITLSTVTGALELFGIYTLNRSSYSVEGPTLKYLIKIGPEYNSIELPIKNFLRGVFSAIHKRAPDECESQNERNIEIKAVYYLNKRGGGHEYR